MRRYRRLNAESQVDMHPMPRVDELIDWLGDVKSLDLLRGYWQVSVNRDSPGQDSIYNPVRIKSDAFGLQGTSTTFQCMMDIMLDDVGEYATANLDDVVIHSNTCEERLLHFTPIGSHWSHYNPKEMPIWHGTVHPLGTSG